MVTFPLITMAQVEIFFLVLVRIGGMVFMVPVFNDKAIPWLLKTGITLLLSLLMYPFVISHQAAPPQLLASGLPAVLLAVIREMGIGISVGFMAAMLLAAVQTAGQFMGFQMGFSIVNVIDPVSSVQVSIIAQFQYLVALLVFLAVGAHRWFIKAMYDSFSLIPLAGFHLSNDLLQGNQQFASAVVVVVISW